MKTQPIAALNIVAPAAKTIYPEPFAATVAGREKRKLGNHFGLKNFGVNLTRLAPGAASALLHHHSKQDEFIYILDGAPTLVLGAETYVLKPGDCVGFPAANGIAHQLTNRSEQDVLYIEVGDRTAGDEVEYPNDDLKATMGDDGAWRLTHKDGRPY
ncbi:MAG: cupin domain-containing protein [Leptospirales bacterium]